MTGFALFDTAIGTCAITWVGAPALIISVQLPESSAVRTRARARRLHPDAVETAPPPDVAQAIERIGALLGGGSGDDLSDLPLDLDAVPPFNRRVYELARTIPPGATLTYGEVAKQLGDPGAARAVGQALGNNPFPIVVPCHRVTAAGGRSGGFSATGGANTKLRMLAIEGAPAAAQRSLFDDF
jgi:methylated-DNA-[protein]-cysteine S-methyltransferase